MSKKIYITWSEIESRCKSICDQIKDSINVSTIIGVSRGGLIPATLFAKELNVREVLSFGVKSYPEEGDYENRIHEPIIYQDINTCAPQLFRGDDILIVDDVSDKGNTFKFITNYLLQMQPSMNLYTSSLYIKEDTSFKPHWWGNTLNDWIVFPWERYKS